MKKGKTVKRLLWSILFLFIFFNMLAAIHAYKFTHFSTSEVQKTKKPEKLSVSEKLKTLFTGVNNPRPVNIGVPPEKFEHITISSNKKLDCWYIPTVSHNGTVILFHGYGSNKSALIKNSSYFVLQGYNTLLVDFQGSGASEGNQTTIGYDEAREVKDCYNFIKEKGDTTIFLYGGSMGAAAILKAVHDYTIKPKGIILECPFGTMYKTICSRFHNMGLPSFPAASLLTFWGGVENGFWAFSYKPEEYAKAVKCPALLMYGEQDKNVSRDETDKIYVNLGGSKQLGVFPTAGHENYLLNYENDWMGYVSNFMDSIAPKPDRFTVVRDTLDFKSFPTVWGYRFVVAGDFNGKGRQDTLVEHYYSQAKHRETNKYLDSVKEYEDQITYAVQQNPKSFFTCSNSKIDTLQIAASPQLFGVAWIMNAGDLMGNGKDVLEYVVNWADESSVNSCHLVTWTGKKWKELFRFEIRDWQLPDLPGYATGYGLFGVSGGMTLNHKNDTVNVRLEKELKAFKGFVTKIKPGVVSINCEIIAEGRTITVDLNHPPTWESLEEKYRDQ